MKNQELTTAKFLQQLREHFTSQPRELSSEPLTAENAVLAAARERAAIAEFIVDSPGANPVDFRVAIHIVAVSGADGMGCAVPEKLEAVLELAARLQTVPGVLFAGLLIAVADTTGAVRWEQPFASGPEAVAILAKAAAAQSSREAVDQRTAN
jgi:hypothetical protein